MSAGHVPLLLLNLSQPEHQQCRTKECCEGRCDQSRIRSQQWDTVCKPGVALRVLGALLSDANRRETVLCTKESVSQQG
jgi:hypothetical protein